MKPDSKIPGIIMIVSGIVLCVVEQFVIGVIILLVGIYFTIIPQPTPKKQTQSSGQRKSTPSKKASGQGKNTPAKKASGKKSASVKPVPTGAPAVDAYAFQGTPDRYFDALLRGCFPEYSVGQNVAVGKQAVSAPSSWECACGAVNTGKFCAECGKAKPVSKDWTCTCGVKNTGKFCSECGSTRPVAAAADPTAPKVSFMLYRGSAPACAILLTPKNQWNTDEINATVEACDKAGIPCLKFYEEFRNEADYVINRINQVLC